MEAKRSILQEFCTEENERILQQETTKQRMVNLKLQRGVDIRMMLLSP